ncbi:MAG: DNA mismatch repair endonuclease MutL [Clostridia bacterium]|nr:DNA mismatch repair endonuclease MutL [Clostridia bacterium]
MGKINLLSSKIFNRIAAGEVVERPFSVVKELVENSIDAGATCIEIAIENGGISSITITDNGHGIEKDDLKKALLPHATSKISKLSDLDNISSLGFRGEALASIASVSKISIVSKPKNQELGAQISADGGEIAPVEDCGASDGTQICVKNLFFNTPVREKFLRSERSEESEISNTITRFILGNPNISFKYVADGKTIYQSYGDGFESAMVSIYGAQIIKDCYYVDTIKNGIKISGYLGKQYFTKGNRSYQTVFINGRYIVNQTISSAITNAYSSYMMKRQYPFYVLSVEMPTEIVDVNVHPNKLDVRFINNQIVYGALYSVVSKVLDGSSEALNIVSNNTNNQLNTIDNRNNYVKHNGILNDVSQFKKEILDIKRGDKVIFSERRNNVDYAFEDIDEKKDKAVDIFEENKAFLESLTKKKELLIAKTTRESALQQEIKLSSNLKFVAQVLNTFLIFEDGTDLYFADQHAAHERILFDKLNDSLKNNQIVTQPLLLPFVLTVNNSEYDFIISKIDVLNALGIEICDFGRNSIKISALPSFLTQMNLQKFFNEILSDLDGLKSITVNDILTEKLAQKACKSAVKAGDKLSDSEIEFLTSKLKQNLGLKCPHGRPVLVKISRMEIDKWFKRIV